MKKTIALIAAATAAVSLSTTAFAECEGKVTKWRLAETWPTNFPIFGDVSKTMAANVKAMTGDCFEITIDSKNKHKSAFGIFDFVHRDPKRQARGLCASDSWSP